MNTPRDNKYTVLNNAIKDAQNDVNELIRTNESGVAECQVLFEVMESLEAAEGHANGARRVNYYWWQDTVTGALRRVENGESTADDAAILRRAIK